MNNIRLIISCANLVLILLVIRYWIFNKKIEPMADVKIPPESIPNIASLYNGNTLAVDNLKVTGKITTNELEKNKTKTKNGTYSKFFALTGEDYNGNDLAQKGALVNRYGRVTLLHKGEVELTSFNGGTYWMHIKPRNNTITINDAKTVDLK